MEKNAQSVSGKNAWGQWLQAPTLKLVPPTPPTTLTLVIVPPAEWPEEKRRRYAQMEKSLLTHPLLNRCSVLPPGCVRAVRQLAIDSHGQSHFRTLH